MLQLLLREFTVGLPLEQAWQHLARVERWPSWARHIKKVELQPPGELAVGSTGRMILTNGIRPNWKVTELHPHRNWVWVGRFLSLMVHYDHRFEAIGPAETRITFAVAAEGFGVSVLGRLFARVYRRDMGRAIARLILEMDAAAQPPPAV